MLIKVNKNESYTDDLLNLMYINIEYKYNLSLTNIHITNTEYRSVFLQFFQLLDFNLTQKLNGFMSPI